MYQLKLVIKHFMAPPGFIILFLIVLGLWSLWDRRWRHASVLFIISILSWLFSIAPVSDVMLKPLESNFSIPQNPKGDVIILLGGAVNGQMPDLSGTGAPSQQMLFRLFSAVRLQKRSHLPLIISGRGNNRNHDSAKSVLLRICSDLGGQLDQIIIEDKSRDTFENAIYASQICKKYGFKKPILVTSAYHLKRGSWCFEKVGLQVIPYPAGFETWEGKQYYWSSYLPGDFRKSTLALREHLGLAVYHLLYHLNIS